MNEQQLADLFSTQIDNLLDGNLPPEFKGPEELSDLLNLGQELSQLGFQPGPAAQAAFQSQLAGWFGSAGSGLATTILGSPKIWLVTIGAAVTLLGAGLGLIGLLNSNEPQDESDGRLDAPVTVELPATNIPLPAETQEPASPEATPSNDSSSASDSLPAVAPSLGDTLPTPTASPEPTVEGTDEPALPSGTPGISGDDEQDTGDGPNGPGDDHDRGHGNDPDGVDEDNPGNSSGPPGRDDRGSVNNDSPGNVGREQDNNNSEGNNDKGGEGKGSGKK